MKSKLIILLFTAAMLAAPFAANAANPDTNSLADQLAKMIQLGKWQSTVKVNISVVGTNMKLPTKTQTVKRCVTRKDLDEMAAPKLKNGMKCDITRKELTGNALHIGMTCTGSQGTLKLTGKTIFTSETTQTSHFVMTGTMHGMNMKIVADGKSKRLGDCTEDSSNSSGK